MSTTAERVTAALRDESARTLEAFSVEEAITLAPLVETEVLGLLNAAAADLVRQAVVGALSERALRALRESWRASIFRMLRSKVDQIRAISVVDDAIAAEAGKLILAQIGRKP